MGKEQYVLPNPASMSVPAADVDLLLQSGNSDCAMVYLYLHRWPERPIDVRRTGQELGLSERAVDLGFETDAILMAYDRTVTQTGGLKWPYMNKIIHNWHDKGLHTPEEIQAGDCLPSRRKGNQTAGEPPALRSPGGEKESLRKFYESLK